MQQLLKRIGGCVLAALPKAGATSLWLLKIILPVSLLVRLLQYSGWLGVMAKWVEPLFAYMGLPGETAVAFFTSIFSPLYAPIALITSMQLGVREATILCLMCLISHNLLVESSVQAKTGSSFWSMTILRLVMSFVIAFFLHHALPTEGWGVIGGTVRAEDCANLRELLLLWFTGSVRVSLTIVLIVTALMILHYILVEFNWLRSISNSLSPLMRLFGLPGETAFLWLVGNLVGLAYGSAIMVEQINQKKISRTSGNLLNYHLAVSHSLLEDTLIFAALGIPVLWIVMTRLGFAMLVVWSRRAIIAMYNKQTK